LMVANYGVKIPIRRSGSPSKPGSHTLSRLDRLSRCYLAELTRPSPFSSDQNGSGPRGNGTPSCTKKR
jgi:hypothetical protein